MKKKLFFKKVLLVGLALISLQSCDRNDLLIEADKPTLFKNIEVRLPEGYSDKILAYSQDNYEQIYNSSKPNARLGGKKAPLELSELTVLLSNVKKNYPDLTKMEEKEVQKALKYFDKLDKKGINENLETVKEFFEKLIAYDLTNEISKKTPKKSGSRVLYTYPYDLTSCEFWFLISHNRFADRVEFASDKASELQIQYFGNLSDNTHGNAFKHAIWNALLAKHAGENYGTVSKAVNITKEFTTLHEDCATTGTPAEHAMDLHNNLVGLDYFGNVGYTYQVWCFWICNYNVSGPSDTIMASTILSIPIVLTPTLQDINNADRFTLVKLQ